MNKISDLLHKISYNIDASHLEVNKNFDVFIPENNQEIIEILNDAISNNKKIIIRGSGTNLVGNCLPTDNSYIIDISKINKIYNIENNSITVDAGVIVDDLNDFLFYKNLFFPVIPGSHAVAQIGSMISTNASGMRAVKYGKMEHWINWIEVLYIDKNKKIVEEKIEGDNLKYFLNSEGTLGLIKKVNLKIIEKPNQISLNFHKFDNMDELLNKVKEYKNNLKELNISAIEFIDKKVSDLLKIDNKYNLLVEFENDKGDIKSKEEINNIWSIRDSCYSVVVSNGYELIEDPELEIDKIKEILEWLEIKNIPTFGHIGTGIIHPHYKKDQEDIIREMYELVKKLEGKVSGEHGIGIKKKEFLDENSKKVFIQNKEKYNPINIFGGENII